MSYQGPSATDRHSRQYVYVDALPAGYKFPPSLPPPSMAWDGPPSRFYNRPFEPHMAGDGYRRYERWQTERMLPEAWEDGRLREGSQISRRGLTQDIRGYGPHDGYSHRLAGRPDDRRDSAISTTCPSSGYGHFGGHPSMQFAGRDRLPGSFPSHNLQPGIPAPIDVDAEGILGRGSGLRENNLTNPHSGNITTNSRRGSNAGLAEKPYLDIRSRMKSILNKDPYDVVKEFQHRGQDIEKSANVIDLTEDEDKPVEKSSQPSAKKRPSTANADTLLFRKKLHAERPPEPIELIPSTDKDHRPSASGGDARNTNKDTLLANVGPDTASENGLASGTGTVPDKIARASDPNTTDASTSNVQTTAASLPLSGGIAINPKFFRLSKAESIEAIRPHVARVSTIKPALSRTNSNTSTIHPKFPLVSKDSSASPSPPSSSTPVPSGNNHPWKISTTTTNSKGIPICPQDIPTTWRQPQTIFREDGKAERVIFSEVWASPEELRAKLPEYRR